MLSRKIRRLKQRHHAKLLKDARMNRLLTHFEHSDDNGLDLEQMEKDINLHKNCVAGKCVVVPEHIESCQNENTSNTSNIKPDNPF